MEATSGKPRVSLLSQQFFDVAAEEFFAFGAFPVQFAHPPVAHVALLVDQVDRGPHAIAPGVPVLAAVVHEDGEGELGFSGLRLDLFDVMFVRSFRGVDPDDRQAAFLKRIVPTPVPGVIADAVNSPKGPEVQRNDLAPQLRHGQGWRIQPAVLGIQFRGFELHVPHLGRVDRRSQNVPQFVELLPGQDCGNLLLRAVSRWFRPDGLDRGLAVLGRLRRLLLGLGGLLEYLADLRPLLLRQVQFLGYVVPQERLQTADR